MIQLFISFISEDELSSFEIILWCYQHYQNEIKDIDYLISIYMINLFVKIRYQNLSFDFEWIHSSFSKINKWIITLQFIKAITMFEEAINDFYNILRDDICNTKKEVINIVMKEWIWMQFNLIYNSIRLQM